MRIAVCMNETTEIGLIEEYLQHNLYRDHEFDFFSTTEKLIKNITANRLYSIYFLSIEIENGQGLLLARKIRSIDLTALIIFVANDGSLMPQVFDVYAFDYLTRPLNEEKLANVMIRAKRYVETTNKYVVFSFNRETVVLLMKDIVCISKSGRVAYVHTIDKTYKTYLTMTEVLTKLNKSFFVRIHGSYVINLHYVIEIMKNEVLIKSMNNQELQANVTIPISRKFKEELKKNYLYHLEHL